MQKWSKTPGGNLDPAYHWESDPELSRDQPSSNLLTHRRMSENKWLLFEAMNFGWFVTQQ